MADPTPDDNQLVADFVRRLRRIALHLLALDPRAEMPDESLYRVMTGEM